MRYLFTLSILATLFLSIAILSGYKSESSSGCSPAPEIDILDPEQGENIESPPVNVEFEARQNSTDLTSIDLSKLSAIIIDNMNKTIDITQYISKNCDLLKKNCRFRGDINLSEGELIGGIVIPIRVGGLVPLPIEPDSYSLVGETDSHPVNHYGNPEFIDAIQKIARKYKEYYKQRLRINDISLEYGGLFDIYNNWMPPHKTHRQGKNVDISAVSVEGGMINKNDLIDVINELGLSEQVRILYEENPPHYHLTYNN
ncbi:MAG: hypothetical protein ACPL7I_10770 [Myxococcota bacterium]